MGSSAKRVINSDEIIIFVHSPNSIHPRRHQQYFRGPRSEPWTPRFVYNRIHLVHQSKVFVGSYNQQRLQLLRIHGKEFEEFKFVLIASEFVDNHALHVRSQAFNWTDILKELGKVLPTGFIGRWIMKDRLDVQRVNVGKASEEAGQHLGLREDTKIHLQGQYPDAWNHGARAHYGVRLDYVVTNLQ